MISIILWSLGVFLESVATWFWKKAIGFSSLSWTMFKMVSQIVSVIFVLILYFIYWFDEKFLSDYHYLLLLWWVTLTAWVNILLQAYVFKNVKLSELLPYDNLDKIFTIIWGFILFYWTEKWVSIVTFLISLLTVFVIIWFSVDFKNFSMKRIIWVYIIQKLFKSAQALILWFILIKYSVTTFAIANWIFEVIFFVLIAIISKDSFKSLVYQSKDFYKNRIFWTILWWLAFFFMINSYKKFLNSCCNATLIFSFSFQYINYENYFKRYSRKKTNNFSLNSFSFNLFMILF